MYLDFYKFQKNPFHITPDPEFLFLSSGHKEAFAALIYGIEERKGFIAITGEIGVGKTTILRAYLEGADHDKLKVVYIFNAVLSFEGLLKQIFNELGLVAEQGSGVPELVNQLHRFLIEEYKNDGNVALIIDEAQNMPIETLENLRMLSNLETSKDKLVQIVMVGQSEFERKLELTELRQLKQRIAIRCLIKPLDREESLAYIQHRLMRGSSFYNQVFTKGALNRIVDEAKGFPRLINILCDNVLITGFGYQCNPATEKIVKEVISDFRGSKSRGIFRIIVAHLRPWPDRINYHRAFFVDRYKEVLRFFSRRIGAVYPNIAAWDYRDLFRPCTQIIASQAERQAWIKSAFIPEKQSNPANNSVPVGFESEKPESSGGFSTGRKGD
jgi:general secretion pathway protein A